MDFRGDVRHALVDETLADVATGRRFGGCALRDLRFLALPLGAVGEQVPRIARAHDACPGERKGDARGVDGDPAPTPLLCDVCGGARTAGRIEYEVAGISGHQDTALDCSVGSLNHVDRKFLTVNV